MSDTMLLAKALTGRAEVVDYETLMRRTNRSTRGMIASLAVAIYNKPIVFSTADDEVFVLRLDDPNWYGRSFQEMTLDAIPLSSFALNEAGKLVPRLGPEGAADETLSNYQFEALLHVHLEGSIYVAARSEDEAIQIIQDEIQRCGALPCDALDEDPFWQLLGAELIDNAWDYLYEVIAEIGYGGIEVDRHQTAAIVPGRTPDILWLGEDPDDE